MNRYLMIRRLRGPAFLLLLGTNALLAEAHILGWSQSWPFYLILLGVLLLAERAALATEGYPEFPAANYAGVPQPEAGQAAEAAGAAETAKRHQGFENDVNGGQS